MGGGAMAEECVIPERMCFPVPAGVSLAQAAAFPVAFGTAHLALTQYARVTPGQTVLVLGAAGGVGLAAVQVAKALGAIVVAVANGSGSKMRGQDGRTTVDARPCPRSRPARARSEEATEDARTRFARTITLSQGVAKARPVTGPVRSAAALA